MQRTPTKRLFWNILAIILAALLLFSCTKTNKSGEDEQGKKPGDTDDGDGTSPPVNIAGTWLTCGPVEAGEQSPEENLYGCVYLQEGVKSKEADHWEITIIGPDGQEFVVAEYKDADPDSKWNIIFTIPPEFVGKMFEVRGTVSLHGSVQSLTSSSCPDGYILVPGDTFYGTKDFCVMKYEAKIGSTAEYNIPVSTVDGELYAGFDITWEMAKKLCQRLGPNYSLINNNQWMTIAVDIAKTNTNWQGNEIGSGIINHGHDDGLPMGVLNATVDDDPCFGTWNDDCTNRDSTDWAQKRTHQLSNNEIIWDLSGNIIEWVDKVEIDTKARNVTIVEKEFNTLSSTTTSLDVMDIVPRSFAFSWWDDSWNSAQGIGAFFPAPQGGAFRRGGGFNTKSSGIFYLDNGRKPNDNGDNNVIGFRCVVEN